MKRKQTTFYCFSPPVMLATFIVEFMMLFYVLFRYKMSQVTRIVVLMLFFLGLFQLAEYYVCGGLGASPETWSRIGYGAITILPPLSLHLVYAIARKPIGRPVYLAYATGVLTSGLFLMGNQIFSGHVCGGNYVIFQLEYPLNVLHATYYYAWLLAGIVSAIVASRNAKPKVRLALKGMVAGYVAFLLPTAVVNTLAPETTAAIPSIMCGFAVLFALIIVGYILPKVAKPASISRKFLN